MIIGNVAAESVEGAGQAGAAAEGVNMQPQRGTAKTMLMVCAITGVALSSFVLGCVVTFGLRATLRPSSPPAATPTPGPGPSLSPASPPPPLYVAPPRYVAPPARPPAARPALPAQAQPKPATYDEFVQSLQEATPMEAEAWRMLMPCAKCKELARVGFSENGEDGGYLMCKELLTGVKAAYSYGISGRDSWGAQVSDWNRRAVVHQYDCTTSNRPKCPAGLTCTFDYHQECLSTHTHRGANGWQFGSLRDHLRANGELPRGNENVNMVLKMDVEDAEWDVFADPANKDLLAHFSQVVVEFHRMQELNQRRVSALRALAELFDVVHVHANNCCGHEWRRGLYHIPHLIEISYVRKGLAERKTCESVPPQSPLDTLNEAGRPAFGQIMLGP